LSEQSQKSDFQYILKKLYERFASHKLKIIKIIFGSQKVNQLIIKSVTPNAPYCVF